MSWILKKPKITFTNVFNERSSYVENYTNTATGKMSVVWDIENEELWRVSFSLGFWFSQRMTLSLLKSLRGLKTVTRSRIIMNSANVTFAGILGNMNNIRMMLTKLNYYGFFIVKMLYFVLFFKRYDTWFKK